MNDNQDDRYRESLRESPRKEATYEELRDQLQQEEDRVQDQLREDEEQALDQIGEICVAMGWQEEARPRSHLSRSGCAVTGGKTAATAAPSRSATANSAPSI